MSVHFSPLPPQNVIFVKVCRRSQASLEYRSAGKKSPFPAGDLGSIPGLGRSCGEKNSYPFQYSGLENSMQCIVHGSHFRLPMRIADQRVYLTFHLCNATFCFFSKTVLVYTQQHYINISWFHMTSNSWCFQAFKIFDHLGRVQSII